MNTRVTLRLPDEQVQAARRAVAEGRARSISEYVSRALARKTADEELLEMIAEMKAEYGEPSPEHYAWARKALGIEE